MNAPLIALTIAGFDTSSGAGLQADLLTFHNHGYHPLTAVTSIVVETPLKVTATEAIDPRLLQQQVSLLLETYPVAAIKIGLLASAAQVALLTPLLKNLHCPIVIDPVGIASTGSSLQTPDTPAAILTQLAPLATLMTPNLPEARQLLNLAPTVGAAEAASLLEAQTGQAVLLTGGHNSPDSEELTDHLAKDGQITTFSAPRIESAAPLHGTGCVLSSALAASLGQGHSLPIAADKARQYLRTSLRNHQTIPHQEPLLALNHHSLTSHDQ